MKQRILCAMASILKPKWIIADEPTKGIDSILRKQMIDMFKVLRDRVDCGLIIITHDLGVAKNISDMVVVLKNGQINCIGLVDILRYPRDNTYIRALVDSDPRNYR